MQGRFASDPGVLQELGCEKGCHSLSRGPASWSAERTNPVGRIGPFEGFHVVRFYPALGAPRDDKKQRRINPADSE
jgi:hypothetical protein